MSAGFRRDFLARAFALSLIEDTHLVGLSAHRRGHQQGGPRVCLGFGPRSNVARNECDNLIGVFRCLNLGCFLAKYACFGLLWLQCGG